MKIALLSIAAFSLLTFFETVTYAQPPSIRDLNQPLNPAEIESCRKEVDQTSRIRTCITTAQCDEIDQYFSNGQLKSPRSYSFQSYFDTGNGFTRRSLTVPAAYATVYSFDILAFRKLLSGLRLAITAGRVTAVFAGGLVSFGLIPAAYFLTPKNKCIESAPENSEDYDACLRLTEHQLNQSFSAEITQALNNPEEWKRALTSQNRDPFLSRVTCLLFEKMNRSYENQRASIKCEGRSLVIGDNRYLVHTDSYLYRPINPNLTYAFGRNGNLIEADLHRSSEVEERIPERVMDEAREIRSFQSQINRALGDCVFSPQPSIQYSNGDHSI